APNWPAAGAAGGWAGAAGTAAPGSAGVAGARTAAAGTAGTPVAPRGTAVASAGAPLGWVVRRRSGNPVPTMLRALVWAAAFGFGLLVTAFVLRTVGLLGVNTAIDIYAGSGARRFGILLVALPLWALLSATMAHFSLEALARRQPRQTGMSTTAGP
ncbi:MAG TPA: hypothetical protein VGR20_19625, partial [Acidimicrobiia bacterium]|nr:hypothetical protein [Acidimicrobiia bacterium]